MIRARNLIHYACVAKGATVLAQFSSTDAAALGAIAAKCLERTPPFHSNFTHTVRSRTYTFLIDEPFVYFAISDHKLEKSEGLAFLKGLRDSFLELFTGEGELEKLSSYCFQGELSSVFRWLLDVDGFRSPAGQKIGQTRMLRHRSGPIRERAKPNNEMDKFKNRLLLGEGKICGRNAEKESDENGGNGTQLSCELPLLALKNGGLLYSAESTTGAQRKMKKVWKKQVWVVLSVDFIICVMLFAVWLCVCSGLKCIDS